MLGVKIFPAFSDLGVLKLMEEVFEHVVEEGEDDA